MLSYPDNLARVLLGDLGRVKQKIMDHHLPNSFHSTTILTISELYSSSEWVAFDISYISVLTLSISEHDGKLSRTQQVEHIPVYDR